MKNKKSIYFLLPAVLAVWGYVVYQIFDFTTDNKPVVSNYNVSDGSNNIAEKTHNDTFTLLLHYRDPFSDKSYAPKNYSAEKPKKNMAPKPQQKTEIPPLKWPAVQYNGKIYSNKSDKQLCIIKINGADHIVSKGEQTQDILVLDVYNDSVLLSFKGNQKTFVKN